MPPTLDKLEQGVRELMARIDRLREENDAFRRAAAGQVDKVSSEDALGQIEQLKRENGKLQSRLEEIDKRLGSVLDDLDQLDDSGKA